MSLVFVFWVNKSEVLALTLRLFTDVPDPESCTAPPNPPSNLIARRVNSNRVDLSWTDNSNNEFGFEIWRSLDNIRWDDLTMRVSIDVVQYSDLDAAANYYYNVRAWNDCGTTQSKVYRVFIPNSTPISSPTSIETPLINPSPSKATTSETNPTQQILPLVTNESEIPITPDVVDNSDSLGVSAENTEESLIETPNSISHEGETSSETPLSLNSEYFYFILIGAVVVGVLAIIGYRLSKRQ